MQKEYTYTKEELRKYRKEVLLEYESRFPDMTEAERVELKKWYRQGKDIYSNPNQICGENGWPLDFISASRLEADLVDELEGMTQAEALKYLGWDQADVLDNPTCTGVHETM